MTAVLTGPDVLDIAVLGGLAGFAGYERFVLVETTPTSPLFRLQSLEDLDLDFLVVPPVIFFPDYTPEIDDGSAARLDLTDAEDALLLVVLTVGADASSATANLMAPIVINARTRQAAQVVVEGSYPLRAPLRR